MTIEVSLNFKLFLRNGDRMDVREKYNDFFVKCFNLILKREKEMLVSIDKTLSMTEIHVIEAVFSAGGDNTPKRVAQTLRVSPGTLTASVNTLAAKGYLRKEKDGSDKRVIRLFLTEKGARANAVHMRFHERMVDSFLENVNEAEAESLISALEKLKNFLGDFRF